MACFITFEGIEGCGKTTQMKILAKRLETLGTGVTTTREPGGCTIADKIRGILLDAENSALVPLAELLLYAAARAQHVAEVVTPALAAGRVVLCDRFTDATLAYQGYGRELDRKTIDRLNELATAGIRPDLTVLLDCPIEVGLERAMTRINSTDGAREERFELEAREFHRRVRDGYLQLAAREPKRFVVINGAAGVEETAAAIETAVLARLSGRG
ncbi:dTMP kinase [Geobacter sp. AOG1]|uniref:dTMP kinase n=1 Tax=Geobacter sp. AOG1 TaxID=1566346 RepID=UPI001CC553B5|nr:dTMP kinase [Geobacter sp. AOG1]GFE58159.1 thymidylate kinase [Geobacter sp. AOG1]